MPIFLSEWSLLSQPLLYLSAYFERNRREYYDHLLNVSQQGGWHNWIVFFLRGIELQAKDASRRSKRLMDKKEEYRQRMHSKGGATALRLVDELIAYPACNARQAAKRLDVTLATAISAIQKAESAGILTEISGRLRNRVWVAAEIFEILQVEEPQLVSF